MTDCWNDAHTSSQPGRGPSPCQPPGGAISCHYMEDNLNTNYELSKIATITTEFTESLYLTIIISIGKVILNAFDIFGNY